MEMGEIGPRLPSALSHNGSKDSRAYFPRKNRTELFYLIKIPIEFFQLYTIAE